MCQYTSECPVGRHRPGTICQYASGRRRMFLIGLVLCLLVALVIVLIWMGQTGRLSF